VARSSADKSIPPPLRALGGWADAEWFDRAVLLQDEVVGLTLPKLPGLRKQSFELAERAMGRVSARKGAASLEKKPAGISDVLEAAGTARVAAFRRPRFFFEAAPTLFFAEIPAAALKPRAADRLRSNLIGIFYRGCVLACDAGRPVIAMFWPEQETDVTSFVTLAGPPYPLHVQFGQAAAPRPAAGGTRAAEGKASHGRAERERLLAEMDLLRNRIAELQRGQSVLGAMETLGLDDARLKAMLLLLHPDKHGNSEAANEAAKWVNGLRDALKAKRVS
jgi:hypothetical protein